MAVCGEDCDDNARVVALLRGATTRVRNPTSSAPWQRYDATGARGGATKAVIHATSRRSSCNPRHQRCKVRSLVLQPPIAGGAKVGRRSCQVLPRGATTPSPELQRTAAGASKAWRWCYNLPPPELQRPAVGATTPDHRSCKGWPHVLQKPDDSAAIPHHLSFKDQP
jgi:hypothetical protein